MRGSFKSVIGFFAFVLCLGFFKADVQASTGIYVGKDVSADETTIIGVSVESSNMGMVSMPEIVEKGEYKKGDVIEASNGYKYTLPEDNAKMIITRTMTCVEDNDWNCSATNEYGVSVMSTITSYISEEAEAADPFVEDGLYEEKLASIVASTSKSADEAVKLLCSIVEETGAASSEIVLIADQESAWVFENFTGHEYVAKKLPADVMAVFSNDPIIKTADPEDPDTICSKGVLSLPEENGFAVYDDDKNIDLIATYNLNHGFSEEAHIRGWVGHDLFAPSENLAYSPDEEYDIFFTPDEKVSITEVFDFFRNRFEGTDYDLTDRDNASLYWGINNQKVANVDVIQIFGDVPAAMSTVLWETPANPTASPFIPYPAGTSELPEIISTDAENANELDETAQFDFIKLNNSVVTRRNLYGASIRDYWKSEEAATAKDIANSIRDNWKHVYDGSSEAGSGCFNDFVEEIVSKADEDCIRISNELNMYLFNNGIYSTDVKDEELPAFQCSVDVEAIAQSYGWDALVEDGVLSVTRDGKTIEVELEGDEEGVVRISGYDIDTLLDNFITEGEFFPDDEEEVDVIIESEDDEDGDSVTEVTIEEIDEEDEEDEEAVEEDEEAEEAEETDEAEEAVEEDSKQHKDDPPTENKASKEELKASQDEEDITRTVTEKVEVDTIAELEEYFGEKIAAIPRNGWAENEITGELNKVAEGVASIISRHFTGDLEQLMGADYNKLGEDIINDPETADAVERISKAGTDLSGLISNYFDSLYKDVAADVEDGRLTQEGAENILLEAEREIEGIATVYLEAVQTSFSEVFDTELSEEEFNELLDEISNAADVMDEYGVIDLEGAGLKGVDLKDLSEADIDVVITLDGMDQEIIDGISDIFGVDAGAILDQYVEAINEAGLN
ncbi:MAG: C69 family dipeptidase [Lachnospiraceae bacterium]|nr:C69 family dipeptidase [Lachnospiraceae bacterium]